MLRDPPHYLPRLKTTTVPRRLLWLDCQADTTAEHGCWVERWQAGALGTTHWTSKRNQRRDTMSLLYDPQAMWCVASDWCKPGRRVTLWAYDLAWQLRISQAMVHLPPLGWRLERIVLERGAAWALFRDGKRTLMMCDLKSWAPVELDKIRVDLQLAGLDRGDENPGDGVGLWTTSGRATVVREAVLQILDWIAAGELGPFRPTGSGQSYAAFRRQHLAHNLLVHDDVERLGLERRAMWTGRCEAWRHGELTQGGYVEYDMVAAYTRIASETDVPAIAGQSIRNPRPATLDKLMDAGAVLAECHIETDSPCVPTSLGDRTVWPVGSFRTVLWDPELRLALEHARRVTVTRAWSYRTAPALRSFASWVLDMLHGSQDDLPPVARRVVKHWSRCLVGRLGLRYRSWERFGTLPEPDLRLIAFIDADDGTITDLLHAGHDRLILTELTEALDSLPQIPGWIMSECRRRLWDAMTAAGLDHVVYVDTDSIILAPSLTPGRSAGGSWTPGPHWAVKGRYDTMIVHGPRNLVCHDQRRVSGLPLTARQTAPLEFTGQVMRSIKESMRAGELDHVASIPRRFVLDAPDLRRQHVAGGRTIPYTLQPQSERISA